MELLNDDREAPIPTRHVGAVWASIYEAAHVIKRRVNLELLNLELQARFGEIFLCLDYL